MRWRNVSGSGSSRSSLPLAAVSALSAIRSIVGLGRSPKMYAQEIRRTRKNRSNYGMAASRRPGGNAGLGRSKGSPNKITADIIGFRV